MDAAFDWSLTRTFLAVTRSGSFSGAARELRQTPPTVRRQIEHLETLVGGVLFTRSHDGVGLTPLAERLVEVGGRMESAAAAFAVASSRERFAGVVRIAVDETIGTRMLAPLLAQVQDAHGELRFELWKCTADRPARIAGADLAISSRRQTTSGDVTSRLATIERALYASSDWLERRDRTWASRLLEGSPSLIGDPWAPELAVAAGAEMPLDASHIALRTSDADATFAAVTGGLGAGVLPVRIATRTPRLERLLPLITVEMEIWMATHPDLKDTPQIRVTLDRLRHGLGAAR